jgi:hypothetical protein
LGDIGRLAKSGDLNWDETQNAMRHMDQQMESEFGSLVATHHYASAFMKQL